MEQTTIERPNTPEEDARFAAFLEGINELTMRTGVRLVDGATPFLMEGWEDYDGQYSFAEDGTVVFARVG